MPAGPRERPTVGECAAVGKCTAEGEPPRGALPPPWADEARAGCTAAERAAPSTGPAIGIAPVCGVVTVAQRVGRRRGDADGHRADRQRDAEAST